MEKYKDILRYHFVGLSQRQTADIVGVSRNTVSKVINAAKVAQVEWDGLALKTEEEINELLFPKLTGQAFYVMPDFESLVPELRRKGVTKKLLWEEYVNECHASEKIPFQYAQFCVHFNRYLEQTKATMYFQHSPGDKVEVDWAGQTIPIKDIETGAMTKSYVFVATLPYSQYTYVEVTDTMKQENWIQAHVNMFNYFGGSTSMIICDNLKTGVIKHPKNGDIVLNAQYRELADYYRTAIIPAKPRTPKGKASVESTVGKISTQIIAALRNKVFYSVYEANQAVIDLLVNFNQKQFQKRPGSRQDIFQQEEKEYLSRLPQLPYQYGEWKIATVQYNYHISVDKMYYSIPYEYIKHKVDVRITKRLIEVFFKQKRICTHRRLYGRPGQYSTTEAHMPLTHQQSKEWNATRFLKWAKQIGESTHTVIERLLASYRIEQQSYTGCRSLLKLADHHSPQELEAACKKALTIVHAPRYQNIKRIIEVNQSSPDSTAHSISNNDASHAVLRGRQYYGGIQDESTQL